MEGTIARLRKQEEIDEMPGSEVPEKRTAQAKLYNLGEDLYQAVLYDQPVHYWNSEANAWEDIDNELEEQSEDGVSFLTNRRNGTLRARMATTGDDWLVRLESERGQTLSWRLEEPTQKDSTARIAFLARVAPQKEVLPQARSEGPPTARGEEAFVRMRGKAFYQAILPDTDMRCAVEGTDFKEEIIFRTREAVREITFLMKAPMTSSTT